MFPKEIHLSFDELLQLKVIGEGKDGIVYHYSDKTLLKIYRKRLSSMKHFHQFLRLPDKVYDKNQLHQAYQSDQIIFQKSDEQDFVRLYSKYTLTEIVKKQQYVKRSQLPQGPVFIDQHFMGCFFQYLSGIPIHNLYFLPLSFKRVIARSLIDDIEELLHQFIYPIDLNNSPFVVNQIFDESGKLKDLRGHSQILVQILKRKTNLIDMDGKSTIYTDYFDESLYQYTLNTVCSLLLEFLYGFIYMNEYSEDPDSLVYELKRLGFSSIFANHVANGQIDNIKDIRRALNL